MVEQLLPEKKGLTVESVVEPLADTRSEERLALLEKEVADFALE